MAATEATGSPRSMEPTRALKHRGRRQQASTTLSCKPSARGVERKKNEAEEQSLSARRTDFHAAQWYPPGLWVQRMETMGSGAGGWGK